jgi:hypothetical protein
VTSAGLDSSAGLPDLLGQVGLLVRVLGVPSVPERPLLNRRETQLAVFLACKDRPVSTASVQDALWNGQAIAAKTVWNLVTRTRTKLGGLSDGRAVMPPADRVHNTLQLAPDVDTDLALLGCVYEQALDSSTVDAIGVLRAGLGLVEGPPFDAAGYDWAHHGEQWVTDASVLIEQAALLLVELACGAGDLDVARFAVSCGLRGLPGNEPLYRARMRLEHQAGNLAAVHSAYRELVGFLEELELEPSSSTERLYREMCGATARV